MTLTMYLVRHGQTLFNRREVVQGWVDSPLTDLGVAQARGAARTASGPPLVGLYSSTSERAGDTAECIAEHHPGIDLVRTKALKELHFGELEATPNATFESGLDVRQFFADVFADRSRDSPAESRDGSSATASPVRSTRSCPSTRRAGRSQWSAMA